MVSGRATGAAAVIELAGAKNTIEAFEGFRPLTAEAAIGAAPDVIVMPARGLESVGGAKGLLALPGIAETPAAKAGRIVAVDDLAMLGAGPRMGEAVLALATALGTPAASGKLARQRTSP